VIEEVSWAVSEEQLKCWASRSKRMRSGAGRLLLGTERAAHETQGRLRPDNDPPPDLAIEVELTPSALDRMSIDARLGVPEVWRYDGSTLTIDVPREGGPYELREDGAA
jgi:Uma2 family endonuclease